MLFHRAVFHQHRLLLEWARLLTTNRLANVVIGSDPTVADSLQEDGGVHGAHFKTEVLNVRMLL
jgi:hypothetical protein